RDRPTRAPVVKPEERVPAEARSGPPHRARRATGLARDLAIAGAGEDAMSGGDEDVGAAKPVSRTEGLRAEGVPAVATAETRDPLRCRETAERAMTLPSPAVSTSVEGTVGSRAMRGHEGGVCGLHARESLHRACRLHSSAHNQRFTAPSSPHLGSSSAAR